MFLRFAGSKTLDPQISNGRRVPQIPTLTFDARWATKVEIRGIHISRKTSEMWGTRRLLQIRSARFVAGWKIQVRISECVLDGR